MDMGTHSDADPDMDDRADLGRAPGIPRWVIVFGVAFVVLVLAFVAMAASGHGPGQHMS